MRYADLTGKKFDMLTVLEPTGDRKSGYIIYRCRCDCGNEILVGANLLRENGRHTCGCQYKSSAVRPGAKFNHLTAIEPTQEDVNKWVFECDCGRRKNILKLAVVSGLTITCGQNGCPFHSEWLSSRNRTHGLSYTKFYEVYRGIIKRCYDPNAINYADYGGRGISVCDEWKDDAGAFYDWAMANGWTEGLTIDRIDVNGPYSPENCRWITSKDQCYNKRNNRLITCNGVTMTLTQWAEVKGMNKQTLAARLEKGWDVESAINTPVHRHGKSKHDGNRADPSPGASG